MTVLFCEVPAGEAHEPGVRFGVVGGCHGPMPRIEQGDACKNGGRCM